MIQRTTTSDRVPPQDIEAERAVLGSILLDNAVLGDVLVMLKPGDFYRGTHQVIFDTIADLFDRGSAIDVVILRDELNRTGNLEKAGGEESLHDLATAVPTAANADHYARIVRDRALRRAVIHSCTDAIRQAYDGDMDGRDLLDYTEGLLFKLDREVESGETVHIGDVLTPLFKEIDSGGTGVHGVQSPIHELNDLTDGLHPSQLVVIAGRPSMGKCLARDSELVLDDGAVVTIEELFRHGRGLRVGTLTRSLRLGRAVPERYVDDGVKPVFEVTTRLGRRVETTLTHPFLTPTGWRPLGELAAGTVVAVPRRLPVFGREKMRECEVKLLAYLIGDGGRTDGSVRFTNGNPRIAEDFAEAIREFGGVVSTPLEDRPGATPSYRVSGDRFAISANRAEFASRLDRALATGPTARAVAAAVVGVAPASVTHGRKGTTVPGPQSFERLHAALRVRPDALAPNGLAAARKNAPNGLVRWLDRHGLMGHGAAGKTVPAAVFRLARRPLALFLNRLFSTDGWATVLASGQAQLGYSTSSERLARQIQHLLLRFGILASLRHRRVRYLDTRRSTWQLDITHAESILTFGREIGIFGKEEALEAAVGLSRERLARFACALDDPERSALAASDVYWDRIVSIVPKGEKQVYDLTIPDTHNFVANDVCVHNTTFALNVAEHAGVVEKTSVAIFSLEMAKAQVVTNMLCSNAKVNAHSLRRGTVQPEEWPRLSAAAGRLSEAPIFIDDTPALSVLAMRAKVRRLKARHGIGLVIVDYLQLMESSRAENRQQEISMISRSLKGLAREMEIPVIAISQLNRSVDAREDHRPRMSDLRESGAIEQDADIIMFLYRDEYYEQREDNQGIAEVIVAKQRNGPTGTVKCTFLSRFMRFENLANYQPPF